MQNYFCFALLQASRALQPNTCQAKGRLEGEKRVSTAKWNQGEKQDENIRFPLSQELNSELISKGHRNPVLPVHRPCPYMRIPTHCISSLTQAHPANPLQTYLAATHCLGVLQNYQCIPVLASASHSPGLKHTPTALEMALRQSHQHSMTTTWSCYSHLAFPHSSETSPLI